MPSNRRKRKRKARSEGGITTNVHRRRRNSSSSPTGKYNGAHPEDIRNQGNESVVIAAESSEDFTVFPTLPPHIIALILCHVDHDTLFGAFSVNRAWHSAMQVGDELWKKQCRRHGWKEKRGINDQSSWQATYRHRYEESCYDCFEPCQRQTLSFGPLRVRLCRTCHSMYAEAPLPHQRLIPKTVATSRWMLKNSDLVPLPFAIEPNPIDPLFSPMHLYRLTDIKRASIAKFGSMQEVNKAWHRRLTRR